MKIGSHEWYRQKYRDKVRNENKLKYREKLQVYLSLELREIKGISPELYEDIKKAFPEMDERLTLDEARMNKLFRKIFAESSLKALEMSYKLDGSFNELDNDPNFDLVERETEGIK